MSTRMSNILTTSTTLIPTKTVMSEIITRSVMMSITEIKIITTSTTTVQTTTESTLIQRTIFIIPSYLIIANTVNVLISFKNMANLYRMLFNSYKNITQVSSKETSNTLISEKKT